MIGWDDIYKVVVAMVPLYIALMLGYGSVRWWRMFTPDQCDAINRLNCYFIMPLFTFEFTTHVNPFNLNFGFIGADFISKFIILVVIALWANCTSKGNFPWSIMSFSLSTLNNTLIIGVPLMKAMYGALGMDLVIQSSIMQSIVWVMILLFMLELHLGRKELSSSNPMVEDLSAKDLEGNGAEVASLSSMSSTTMPSFSSLMKIVVVKLSKNPNCYACIFGVVWALISNKYVVVGFPNLERVCYYYAGIWFFMMDID